MTLKDVEFENPKKYLCQNLFSVDIDFCNPNRRDDDCEVDETEFDILYRLQTW